jgi:hypothetical protein
MEPIVMIISLVIGLVALDLLAVGRGTDSRPRIADDHQR